MDDIRVLVVDDHAEVRSSLCDWIEAELVHVVTCTAVNGEQALDVIGEFEPDVVLMDIGMPGIGGIEATRRLLARRPETRVVMVSILDTASHRAAAAAAGAFGYVAKSALNSQLGPVLRRAAHGLVRADPTRGPEVSRRATR